MAWVWAVTGVLGWGLAMARGDLNEKCNSFTYGLCDAGMDVFRLYIITHNYIILS